MEQSPAGLSGTSGSLLGQRAVLFRTVPCLTLDRDTMSKEEAVHQASSVCEKTNDHAVINNSTNTRGNTEVVQCL